MSTHQLPHGHRNRRRHAIGRPDGAGGQAVLLNTINPAAVNTGYLDEETTDRPLEAMQERLRNLPLGRFGRPDDPARLIGWLATDEGRWGVGQVITSDGGFRL